MMYARIAAGAVAEIIAGTDTPIVERFHPDIIAAIVAIPDGSDVSCGWRWDGGAFTPPKEPDVVVPVPASITRRQMLLALHAADLITAEEALAAATGGAVPATIDAVFGQLPEDRTLEARITWATMSIAERAHPLIAMLIAAGLATSEEVDAIFIDGATR